MAKKQSSHISKRMKARAEQRRKKRLIQLSIGFVILIIVVGSLLAYLTRDAVPTGIVPTDLAAEISVAEAKAKYDNDVFVLDVRTQAEWDEFHIPGTTLIPLDELESRVDEVPRDQEVVVVCRSGNRSQVGRDTLLAAGFEQVTSMAGGVSAWRTAGYPIE